jgi:hypothetical protein
MTSTLEQTVVSAGADARTRSYPLRHRLRKIKTGTNFFKELRQESVPEEVWA